MMRYVSRTLVVSPYHIGLCTTPEAFAKELKRLNVAEDRRPTFMGSVHAHGTAHYFEKNSIPMRYTVIVCIDPTHSKGKSVIEIHGLLVHEATHVWQNIREVLGEKNPSSEFEAYSVQSIAQALMEAYALATRPKRKRK
jgi:hypothetical protein